MRFHPKRSDLQKVAGGRQQVIGEGAAQQLPLLVISQVLEQCSAQTLHHCTHDLTAKHCRVDDASDILDGNIIDQFDMAGVWIDCDMSGVRAIAVSMPVIGKALLSRELLRCELGQGDGPSVAGLRNAAFQKLDLAGLTPQAAARSAALKLSAVSNIADPPITTAHE